VNVEEARVAYAIAAESALYHASWCPGFCGDWLCRACFYFGIVVDAASIALDMAVAERIAGRHPSIEWRREGVAW